MQIPILMYHMVKSVLTESEKTVHVAQDTFEKQLRILSKKEFVSISLLDLYTSFIGGNTLPSKPVIITFDDGYLNNFELAFPILNKCGHTATIFLPTDLIGDDEHNIFNGHPLMNWNEVKEMNNHGISFASHTAIHPYLTRLSDEEVCTELLKSKERLEDFFGESCNFIAYPYGDFDSRVRNLTEEVGYKAACSVKIGLNRQGDDLFALKRISVIDFDNPSRLLRKVTFGLWDAPWSIIPRYYLKRVKEKIVGLV